MVFSRVGLLTSPRIVPTFRHLPLRRLLRSDLVRGTPIQHSSQLAGLSPLHQAIVNEDPWLTNYLLNRGADVNQRCYGAFFCPDDQKSSRTDSLEHEYVELSESAEYSGYCRL